MISHQGLENSGIGAPQDSNICKICGNRDGFITHQSKEMMFGYRDKFAYLECAQCKCLQIQEVPADLAKYYPANYYAFQNPLNLNESFFKSLLRRKRAAYCLNDRGLLGRLATRVYGVPEYYQWFKRAKINFESEILDVGCGSGQLLYLLKKEGFLNLLGVDLFIDADIHYENGLSILKKELRELNRRFDLIMLHHSLEHMTNPLEVLKDLSRLLKPGGCVLVRTPLVSSYAWKKYGVCWVQLDPPRHLFLFSLKGMETLAKRSGLNLIEVEYDSNEFQFYGSEQYLKNIPLMDEHSYWVDPNHSIFIKKDIARFKKMALDLNGAGQGDQACFYLVSAKPRSWKKVLLLDRFSAEMNPGGDTVQCSAIARYLESQGYAADVCGTIPLKAGQYDLAIVFNLSLIQELFLKILWLEKEQLPYILFPIYWEMETIMPDDASELKKKNWKRRLLSRLPEKVRETVLQLHAWLHFFYEHHNKFPIRLWASTILKRSLNPYSLARDALHQAVFVCPNSIAESSHLINKFPSISPDKIKVIYNGCEEIEGGGSLRNENELPHLSRPVVACIGQIGGRKNQLRFVQAIKLLGIQGVLIGKVAPSWEFYFNHIMKVGGDRIIHYDRIERDQLLRLLKEVSVIVQPSFMETPGLIAMEAANAGCTIVVSDVQPVKEYFGNIGYYCNPFQPESIAQAIQNALLHPMPKDQLKQYIAERFRWDHTLKPLIDLLEKISCKKNP